MASPSADKKYHNLLNSHSTNAIIEGKGCEQIASSHKLKNSKSKVDSGHEFYFSRQMMGKEAR